MMKAARSALMFLGTIMFLSGPGQSGAVAQDVEVSKIFEHLQDAANVSGHIVVGFSYDAQVRPQSLPILTADLLKDWKDRTACLRFVSDDGLYEASHEVRFGDLKAARSDLLPFESSEKNYLVSVPRDSMAVVLGLLSENGCSGTLEAAAAIAWNGFLDPEKPASYILKLNSRGADEVFLIVSGEEVTCGKRKTPQRVAFDFHCRIADRLLTAGQPVEVEINQIRRGDFDPPVYVNLVALH